MAIIGPVIRCALIIQDIHVYLLFCSNGGKCRHIFLHVNQDVEHLLMYSRSSHVMDDILNAVAQAQRCSLPRLQSACTDRQGAALVTRLKTAEEHGCHSPGALWKICIRYVEDYEQCCPSEPAAQPSSCCTAPPWPHGGAPCVCTGKRRLCNPITKP